MFFSLSKKCCSKKLAWSTSVFNFNSVGACIFFPLILFCTCKRIWKDIKYPRISVCKWTNIIDNFVTQFACLEIISNTPVILWIFSENQNFVKETIFLESRHTVVSHCGSLSDKIFQEFFLQFYFRRCRRDSSAVSNAPYWFLPPHLERKLQEFIWKLQQSLV